MCANGNCKGCTYQYEGLTNTEECKEDLLYDAAEQLEDADKCNARLVKKCKEMEKQIAELEAQLPGVSEWKNQYGDGNWHCSKCGAIVEKDEQERHYWQWCYHCGSKMRKG